MPSYEDVIRAFTIDKSKEFTDVWNFPSVRPYPGKHPAEKPLELLEHAIETTTFPGDIVLDCFAGSGNTGIAAVRLKRRAVIIEIDAALTSKISSRLSLFDSSQKVHPQHKKTSPHPAHHINRKSSQLAFSLEDT